VLPALLEQYADDVEALGELEFCCGAHVIDQCRDTSNAS
jgi:hypothetical protein